MSKNNKSIDPEKLQDCEDNDKEKHENDEEDWDDWGDAEEDFTTEEKTAKATAVTEVPKKDAVNNDKNKTDTIKENKSKVLETSCKEQLQQQQQLAQPTSSWWGGFTSVLSTATEGIGSITSSVSQGLNQVIGIPEPEELARINAAEVAAVKKAQTPEDKAPANIETDDDSASVFGKNIVSGVTNLGSKVLNTGLDTLEGIGKKTMNILQDNDPLLKNKRKLLGLEPERPNLSDLLKEAKKDAEEIENTLKELKKAHNQQKIHFEPLFEQKCGLVHLEALDILSKESALKLKTLMDSVSGKALKDLQETINEVQELMEPEDSEVDSDGEYTAEELKEKLKTTVEDLDIPIQFDDIVSNWQQTLDWWSAYEETSAQAVYEQGITALAECCALAMNKLHKIAELLLVKEHHSTASEVDSIVQLCHQFNVHLHGVTHRFACKLSSFEDNDEAKNLLNTLCGELLVAVQQVDSAFKLFLSIIQIGAA